MSDNTFITTPIKNLTSRPDVMAPPLSSPQAVSPPVQVNQTSSLSELDGQPDFTSTTGPLINNQPAPKLSNPKRPFPWKTAILCAILFFLLGGLVATILKFYNRDKPKPDNGPVQTSSILTVNTNQTLTVKGDLQVSGTTTLQDLTVNGLSLLQGGATITGSTSINGDLTVNGNITANNFPGTGGGGAGSRGATGPQGPAGAAGSTGSGSCINGSCVSLQTSSPGVQETGHINISGNITSGNLLPGTIGTGTAAQHSSTKINTLDSEYEAGEYATAIVIGADGFGRLAYSGYDSSTLKFARCTNKECSQKVVKTVATSIYAYNADIKLGSDGFPRIVYDDYYGSYPIVRYIRCLDADCSSHNDSVIEGDGASGYYGYYTTDIEMGSDGFPRIAYDNYDDYSIHYARCTDDNCSSPVITPLVVGDNYDSYQYSMDMVLSGDGFPRIAYLGNSDNYLHLIRCTDADCASPVNTVIDSTTDYPGYYGVRMKLGSDNLPRIAYIDDDYYHIFYLRCTNQDCSSNVKNEFGPDGDNLTYGTGYGFGFDIDSSDVPHFAYMDSDDYYLRQITCSDAICSSSTDTLVDATYEAGYYAIALAVDNTGGQHFAYTEDDTYTLRYAYVSPEVPATVSGGSNIGTDSTPFGNIYAQGATIKSKLVVDDIQPLTSGSVSPGIYKRQLAYTDGTSGQGMIMGPDGFPRIAYEDQDNYRLTYARCTDANCSSPIVTQVLGDSSADSGYYGGHIMALGSDGFARIMYQDYNDGSLKMVRCLDQDCTTKNLNTIDADGSNDPGGYGATVTMGLDGFPRIAYQRYADANNADYSYALYYARCTDADCSSPVTNVVGVSYGNDNTINNLVIGSDGFARMVYEDGNDYSLNLARCTDANCASVTTTIIDDGSVNSDPGYYGSVIQLGPDGLPRIAYVDSNNYYTHFAICNDADCTNPTITLVLRTYGDGYNGIGMALNSAGNASIAYEETSNGYTSIIQCGNATCSSHNDILVDSNNSYGIEYGATIIIGSDDLPRLLYSDGDDYYIHFARLLNISGVTTVTVGSSIGASTSTFGIASLQGISIPQGLPDKPAIAINHETESATSFLLNQVNDSGNTTLLADFQLNGTSVASLDNNGYLTVAGCSGCVGYMPQYWNANGNNIYNTNVGNVGIGTSIDGPGTPRLHVLKTGSNTIGQDVQFAVESGASALSQIGIGWGGTTRTYAPAVIGARTMDASGSTRAAIFFATRDVTTDTAPIERLTIATNGNVSIPGSLTVGSCTGCGSSSQWATSGNNIYNSNSGNVGIGTTTPLAKLQVKIASTESTPAILGGYDYTVNNASSKALFTSAAWYEAYGGIVGTGGSNVSVDIPSLGSYGSVGVVGASEGYSGGRLQVGVYGLGQFNEAFSGNSANIAKGGYFLGRLTSAVNDFNGTLMGSNSSADASAAIATGGSVYGSYNQAVGVANTTVYGGYFTGTGGTTNYGVYSAAGRNYFNGATGINTTTFGTNNKLIVNPYSTVDNLATAQINTNAATNKGLVVQGFASQSADLLQFQNSSGSPMFYVQSTGYTTINPSAASNGDTIFQVGVSGADYLRVNQAASGVPTVKITSSAAGFPVAVIRGAAAQTADLLQLQNSSGSVLSKFDASGNLNIGNKGTATSQLYVSGTVPTAATGSVATGTNPQQVYVQGRYAYLTNHDTDTLQIFDVSNSASPVSVGSVATNADPLALRVQANYAYVVTRGSSISVLHVFDISNPANPTLKSTTNVGGGNGVYGLYVSGSYAYVADTGNSALKIYNITNASSPVLVGSVATTNFAPWDVYVQGRYAYVVNQGGGGPSSFQIFDVSNPASPTSVSSTSTGSGALPVSVYVQGRYAYIAYNGSNNLQIFDISNSSSPSSVSTLSVGQASVVYVQGRYAYVTANQALHIIDVSTPASPSDIGSVGVTGALGLFVQGRYAYVTGNNTLKVFDLGGTYTQQLEAGGIETGTLATRGNLTVNNDASVVGGLTIGRTLQVTGDSGFSGNIVVANSGALAPWQANSNTLPSGRSDHSSVTANGYVYVIGGGNSSTVYYAKLNADGSTGSWATTTALPVFRNQHSSVVANGYIYVIGGPSGSTTVYYAKLNTDGTIGSWATTTALPLGRDSHTSVVANGYVYVIGGDNGGGSTQTSVYYAKLNADGTVGSWSTTTVLPAARENHSSVIANGYVYVMGGTNGGTNQTTVYYARMNADGTVGSWSTTTSLTTADTTQSSVVANGYVYSIAGLNTQTLASYAKLNADGTIGSWITNANNIPVGRYTAASVVANGYVYIIGGWSGVFETSVYYASTARVQIGGSLDLVGLQGQNLADGGEQSSGSTGGSLTAGNGKFVGTLEVQGQASFTQGASFKGNLSVVGASIIEAGSATTVAQIIKGAGSQTADLLQAQDSAGTVLSKIDSGGNLTVKAATFNGNITVNGHVITGNTSGSTTIAAGAGTNCSGGSPTATITGNDTSGLVIFSMGTGACPPQSVLGTITFANSYGSNVRVTLTPNGVNGATLQYAAINTGTTSFQIASNNAPTAGVQYSFFYHVEQ